MIDRELAQHYDFINEELELIINYEINGWGWETTEMVERITQMAAPSKQFQKYTGKNIRGTYAHGQKIGYNIDH